jgi:hypothetical protein
MASAMPVKNRRSLSGNTRAATLTMMTPSYCCWARRTYPELADCAPVRKVQRRNAAAAGGMLESSGLQKRERAANAALSVLIPFASAASSG